MVDVVGQGRVEVAQGIVRQRGQVHDRVDPVELLHRDVAQVGVDLRDRREPVGIAERAAAIQVGVEPDDVVSRRLEDGDEDGADVAEMTGDEYAHRDQRLPPMPVRQPTTSLRQMNPSAMPSAARHSMPRSRSTAMNVSGENQSRPAWDGNEASRCATFAEACAEDSGTYRLVVPEVAVPLRHLVLEDRRPAEHLADDLADEPVVLVGVVAARREDQVGIQAGVGGDRLLRRLAEERQEAVPEVADVDPLLGDALEEALARSPAPRRHAPRPGRRARAR